MVHHLGREVAAYSVLWVHARFLLRGSLRQPPRIRSHIESIRREQQVSADFVHRTRRPLRWITHPTFYRLQESSEQEDQDWFQNDHSRLPWLSDWLVARRHGPRDWDDNPWWAQQRRNCSSWRWIRRKSGHRFNLQQDCCVPEQLHPIWIALLFQIRFPS